MRGVKLHESGESTTEKYSTRGGGKSLSSHKPELRHVITQVDISEKPFVSTGD